MEIAAGKVFTVATDELAVLMVFLLIGLVLRQLIKPLQKLFLPAGLIGGALALVLGPQVLGLIDVPATWSGMATPMINVVLTCTMFGVALNKSKIKSFAGAIDLVLLTYFAQMVIGTLAGIGLSKVWTELPYSWGVMTIFTYWGGHGAATTAGTLFEEMGIDGMLSLGIILATLGLIIAMVAGMVVVNIGARRGWGSHMAEKTAGSQESMSCYIPAEKQRPLGRATVSSDAVNGLALQLCFVLLSMWLGRMIFTNLARVPVEPVANIMGKIPALLYGIVGAAIVWAVMCQFKLDKFADKEAVDNISGVALEICICSATATLNLELFASFLAPILIHMVCIIALMSFICIFLVRRWFKKDWFELCLMAFGQGHGSTPSGLALARCVDPDHKSESWEAFGVAMGCVTPLTSSLAAVLPILAVQSQWVPVGIGAAVTLACILFGELVIRRQH